MAAQMIARGHALAGDGFRSRAALDEAEALIRRAADRPEDEPPWMYFYDETWFLMQRGMIELELAERQQGSGRRSAQLIERALQSLPESYRRDRAWFGTCLARAHAATGDLHAAAEVAMRFARDAVEVNRYAAEDLRVVYRRLVTERPHSSEVAELGEALR